VFVSLYYVEYSTVDSWTS